MSFVEPTLRELRRAEAEARAQRNRADEALAHIATLERELRNDQRLLEAAERELAQERGKSEMLAADAGRLVEELAMERARRERAEAIVEATEIRKGEEVMLSYRCNSLKPEHEKCRGDVYDSDEVKWVGCTCECHLPKSEEIVEDFNPNDLQEPRWADDSPKLEELVDRLEQALNRIEAIVDRLPSEVRGM